MGKVTLVLVVLVAVVVVGAFMFLAYGHFPPPSAPVEKVLPDARFPK